MKTIVLIENDRDYLEVVRDALSQEGYRVLSATDGLEGIALATKERPDLVLLEKGMPGEGAAEVESYLKAIGRREGLPVLFLTGTSIAGIDDLVKLVKERLSAVQHKLMKVLLVEDSLTDAHLITRALELSKRRNFEIHRVGSRQAAEEYLYSHAIDAIILDLGLPDSRKKATLEWMMGCNFPTVVITGDDDEETVSEAFRHGAQDFLVKGVFVANEVVRCVIYAIERAMVNKELAMYKNNFERTVQDRVNEQLALEKKESSVKGTEL